MKLLKKRILNCKGFSYVLLSVIMVVVLLIGAAVFEIVRLNIQAGAVRNKFEDAIISMCVQNHTQLYQPVREGYAASYGYNGYRWAENNKANERCIRTYLNSAMSNGEIMQCEIVSVNFSVEPAQLAPSDISTAEKFAVSGSITIRIPYRFAWEDLAPITMQLNVKSQWQAQF